MLKKNEELTSRTSFSSLFLFYRKQSNFKSLDELGNALAELGTVLDNSTFSNWQRGARLPKNRQIILQILKIFFLHHGITATAEANLLLEAANQGNLSPEEEKRIFSIRHQKLNGGPVSLSSVHIMMSSKLLIKLEALANQQGISKATLIGHLLEEYLQ